MRDKILEIIQKRLEYLENRALGTSYNEREFWDGKIEELDGLIEHIEAI